MKPRNIDEVCGQPAGSFQKFIKEQQEKETFEQNKVKERIRAAKINKILHPSSCICSYCSPDLRK